MNEAPAALTGNAANAAKVLSAAAKKVRKREFLNIHLIFLAQQNNLWIKAGYPLIGNAMISLRGIHIFPTDGSSPRSSPFGFACVNSCIMSAKGKYFTKSCLIILTITKSLGIIQKRRG